MDDLIRSLLKEFVDEALPMAERLSDSFLELERHWVDGDSGEEVLPQVRSDLHTLKGNSGMMGLVPIQALTHALEDVCALLEGSEPGDPELAALLIEGGDLIVEMIRLSAAEELPEQHSQPLLDKLDRWILRIRDGQPEALRARTRKKTKARRQEKIPEPEAEPVAPPATLAEVPQDKVRIDFRRLDHLLEIVGEAMISRSRLAEAHERLRPLADGSEAYDELERAVESLDRSLRDLQETLVETRLLPVSTVFRRYPRAVRDLALQFDKSVTLVTEGDDTTIDKAIVDRLGDPLLHLVRNAVAHGIESPAERKRLGKPAEATVRLHAQQMCNRVVVSVSDDGGGLDEARIAARGREIGHDPTDMSTSELHGLIFEPGFSTAAGVSTLSGRGVGLDVVASTVETLGGNISVHSEPGKGTTFHLDLPLTLAVIKALFVEVDGEQYAVPLSYVDESFRVTPEAIHTVDGRPVVSRRDELIALADAGDLLGGSGHGSRSYCVVITAGARRSGLVVDRLLGHRDVVVKGLEEAFGVQQIVSGVTILGDGRVVFILDAGRITGGKFTGGATLEEAV
jgi:two-component system chemotaxis sensor kinase CheA